MVIPTLDIGGNRNVNNTIIILVAFVVYMGMMILIGALNSKQSNNEDYFLGGRGLGSWTAALLAPSVRYERLAKLMGLPGAILRRGYRRGLDRDPVF